ncbi:MAG: adventurous gliding motility protein CglE [Clostridia bacterium]|nr:adventurous gliding motility protein CglE [Deltaproteobacteria bacterium]
MKTIQLALVLSAISLPVIANAQSSTTGATPPTNESPSTVREAREPRQIDPEAAVVRGFYIEAKVNGGYMITDANVSSRAAGTVAPQAAGQSEKLGGAAGMQLNVGYDITDHVAFELLGGQLFATGRRNDVVRDVGIAYGGIGARVGLDLTDRLDLILSVGAAYAGARNGVEKADTGLAILGGAGIEYYVHVRHFSVGLQISAIAPVDPSRVFVGLSPQIKYTF